MFCVFGGGKFNYDGNLREPIPQKLNLSAKCVFSKKLGLRKGRAQKGAHGRRSEAITKVLEVILAEDLAGTEMAALSIALESNKPSPRILAPVHLQRALPRLRLVVDSPDIDRDRVHRLSHGGALRSYTPMSHAIVFIVVVPDFEWWKRQHFTAESAQTGHRILGLVDPPLGRPSARAPVKQASPPPSG